MKSREINEVSTSQKRYHVDRKPDIWPPLIGAAVAVLLMVWMSGSDYKPDLVVLAASYALIALGMYVPFVLAGSLSMAYSAYAGIGAYSVAIVSSKTGLSLWLGWILGVVLAMVVAVILSFATRRLSGFFLAAVTLLFATAFATWVLAAGSLTGGAGGISGVRDFTIFGWVPGRTWEVALACLLVLVVATLIERLRRNPFGVILRAMRERPLATEASGVRVADMTTVALGVGAGIASLGGSLFVSFVKGVTPETFTVSLVFIVVFMPLIGGRGTAWGAALGALVVVELTLNFDALKASGELILVVAVIIILLAAPTGILGYLDKIRRMLLLAVKRGQTR